MRFAKLGASSGVGAALLLLQCERNLQDSVPPQATNTVGTR